MNFQLLGHVQGWVGDQPVGLGARKQRFIFALLALEANRLVPVPRLVDLIWPERQPTSARSMVHNYISCLRGLGVEIIGTAAGYELRAEPALIDAHLFRGSVAEARAEPDDGRRLVLLNDALALWRGPALAGVTTEAARQRLAGHLEEARLDAIEDRNEAAIRSGRHRQIIDELISLAGAYPHRQRLTGQLMLALHRSGRPADALHLYERTRRDLADELGVDPGEELRQLHLAILRGEP